MGLFSQLKRYIKKNEIDNVVIEKRDGFKYISFGNIIMLIDDNDLMGEIYVRTPIFVQDKLHVLETINNMNMDYAETTIYLDGDYLTVRGLSGGNIDIFLDAVDTCISVSDSIGEYFIRRYE